MKRKYNYTGRKRISREKITAILAESSISGLTLEIKIDHRELNLSSSAEVYIECYRCMMDSIIYNIGQVNGDIISSTIPVPRTFRDGLKFRIFVVDPKTRRILAHADRIKPEAPSEMEGILECSYNYDIGNEIWRVDYDGDGGAPILKWNRRILGIETLAKNDPTFIMFVAPPMLREVLMHMVFIDGIDSIDDPQIEWHGKWLRFAQKITGEKPPDEIIKNGNFDEETAQQWINNIVNSFSGTLTKTWELFIRKLSGGGLNED